ncbi:MAG: SLC13/DASS family transporter [Bacteriovoracaceae bacterium]|nr:SLC13/DASS family transporter [Bacteriovoracaceae bacterium]
MFKKSFLLITLVVIVLATVLKDLIPLSPPFLMGLITLVIVTWWILEIVPIPVTALMPVVLMPLFRITSADAVAQTYMNSVLMMFVGGFIIAAAMEKTQLHKRLALRVILYFGVAPSGLIKGFLFATVTISMWISNTATTVMMIPIASGVLAQLGDQLEKKDLKKFSTAIFLSIAYAASIGGMGTPVGTPTNLVFMKMYQEQYPTHEKIYFLEWLQLGVPLVLILMTFTYFLLKHMYFKNLNMNYDRTQLAGQLQKMGPMKYEEKWVIGLFVLLSVLWILRPFILPDYIDDGMLAIAVALLIFFIPTREEKMGILNADVFQTIPWDTILLFGGGFAIALGMSESGLSNVLAEHLVRLDGMPNWAIISGVVILVCLLSEVASNMATIQIILPIIFALCNGLDLEPKNLALAATFAASTGFMLPAATAPNALVYGTRKVSIREMARSGFVLDIVAIIVIAIYFSFMA